MSDIDLEDLRRLREDALRLLAHQAIDLRGFLNTRNKSTFLRLPAQISRPKDVKVTSSCSCLMSLMQSGCFDRVYEADPTQAAERAFQRIYDASWRSSGLGLNNAFSTVLVIRTFGFLVESGAVSPKFAKTRRRRFSPLGRASLSDIAQYLAGDTGRFRINKYPPSAALIYWFIDGVDRGRINLKATAWVRLCQWARQEFNRQRSLVVAQHDALMDPIAMAMAACVCARLRKIAAAAKSPAIEACLHLLPSMIELEHAIQVLFKEQGASGIWPKYFPLFHYPEAGSNFCFTFEMLEAVLSEFGNRMSDLLTSPDIIKKLGSAVAWCANSRLQYSAGGHTFCGWNSGGELDSLTRGKPESWATAVVHMFLWELQQALASTIQSTLLRQYSATPGSVDPSAWTSLLDMDIQLQGGHKTSVMTILEREIIKPAARFRPFSDKKLGGRLSALLFGPPGTSKTRLTTALAAKLGWPVVLIDPSKFLSNGIEHIYSRAEEIFNDLRSMSGVVVLFDEMDALVRNRGQNQPLDVTSRFLTTSMLPKLAGLHDQGTLIFFFATNYQGDFDTAIKRPGRFDVLLCVGPPPWTEKLRCIDRFLAKETSDRDVEKARLRLQRLTKSCNSDERQLLDRFTFQETGTFFEGLTRNKPAGVKRLQGMQPSEFRRRIRGFGKYTTLRREGEHHEQFETDQKESRLQ